VNVGDCVNLVSIHIIHVELACSHWFRYNCLFDFQSNTERLRHTIHCQHLSFFLIREVPVDAPTVSSEVFIQWGYHFDILLDNHCPKIMKSSSKIVAITSNHKTKWSALIAYARSYFVVRCLDKGCIHILDIWNIHIPVPDFVLNRVKLIIFFLHVSLCGEGLWCLHSLEYIFILLSHQKCKSCVCFFVLTVRTF